MPNPPVRANATGLSKERPPQAADRIPKPAWLPASEGELLLGIPERTVSPRQVVEAAIERLIGLLDHLDPDADLELDLGGGVGCDDDREGPEADAEFSLGSLSQIDQTRWSDGAAGDIEGPEVDLEPSLGSLDHANQTRWSKGDGSDREGPDDDLEPTLGSAGSGSHFPPADQRYWAQGSTRPPFDDELVMSDDEPEADEDSLGAVDGTGDQTHWAQGDGGDYERTGTVDDVEMRATRPYFDRAALYEVERQAHALARRIRRQPVPEGRGVVVEGPDGHLHVLRTCE